ncbi:protein c-ets-1-B [Acyrthosiphon pisum]|uniref:ETS domain-containing protein n=1 Tax=Acyrthosiphon pisum TaxID=7029 RepID=A0A8R1W481_ACYPI|nr:protein c-ets-1-B [Acyrthosiphon pisum]|eukprot:XP_001948083.2 PREDICTED: protein c-ets-1-B-like [Acyrthosiphon pisum]
MMWALNDVNIANTYESNEFCMPDDYTLSSQWDYDGSYSTNYSENEIDLATVLMNLKEDPSPDGSCNDHHEPSYYDPTTTGGYQQHHHQPLQWQCPSNEQPQHVFVYDSLDGNQARPTHEDCLLPAILDADVEFFKTSNASMEKKRAGRPRGTKAKRSKAEPKLSRIWEFIRDLLLNSQYCPTYICWENYEEGRFRFVQSDKVAKLWGKFKRNERMNYEKFSRAMRYYYKTGVLLPVQGKRLVYKFGPKATGWHTDNPNFKKYTF